MRGNFFKRVPTTLVALAVTASTFAAGGGTEDRLQQLEQQMKQVRTETASGTYGAKTALARPEVDGVGLFLSADALLWKAYSGGSEYAYTDATVLAGYPISGSVRQADFDWSWGARGGIGYNFDHDGWDIYLNFTYFHSSSSDSVSVPSTASVVPLKGDAGLVSGTFDSCLSANTDFKFTYYNLDLDLGRDYYVSKSLSLHPHFGLKNSWLTLKQNTHYSGGAYLGNNFFEEEDSSKLWGIGPSTGINTKWHLG
ncbi:MAG: MOMP family protein, partial [Chlamydiae bacterium]|nr:MOMP family protein [Chlamydiota bacterium]